ncbi:hypothetical protein OFY17_07075 [Marinomonas sp. C2222]|uniref:Uncharacterized protein n=1 Tax=Marinomonas sargassi TaxID=2984494 RepID=A0ABT2YRX6_9GAMM|nr:hypothetical protein [Marinomonas sargassi]MCV2402641.1 hypothetical protein [Marinomonas sargassi]
MDSQQQYEALLAKWGFEDTTAADYTRRQNRIRLLNSIKGFVASSISSIKKISVRPQHLEQAS